MKIQRSARGLGRRKSLFGRHLRSRSASHAAARRPLGGIETLESRQLLAANVLAAATGSISSAAAVSEVTMDVSLANGRSADTAVLAIQIMAADGSSLDPAAATITDANGGVMPVVSAMDDMAGSGSRTVVEVPAGEYSITVDGEGVTMGGFDVTVSLLGDVAQSDSRVGEFERLLASAAVIQTLGTGNFITSQFYAQHGIDLNADLYDSGMDADGDGEIDPDDYRMVEHNAELGPVSVSLQADDEAPVISGVALQNDTGVSDTDRLTTDPTIVGNVTDQSAVTVFQAGIDGAPTFDILSRLGSAGAFTLTLADLNNIAGGALTEGPHTLRLSATDELGNATSTPSEFTFTYLIGNTISSGDIPNQTATEDAPFSLNASSFFTDPDVGDVVTYTASSNGGGLPSWLSINANSGVLSGTPANGDVGSRTITVTGTDSQGATASTSFLLSVENVNDAPTLSPIPAQTAGEDQPFSFNAAGFANDVDAGDVLSFSFTSNGGALPSWLTATGGGLLSGTPTQADVGSFNVTVRAVDLAGAAASETFTVTVEDLGDPPMLVSEIPNQTVDEDAFFTLNLSNFFSDPDVGEVLTFTAVETGETGLPGWLSLNSATGVLSGTPDDADVGAVSITVTATDSTMLSAMDTFLIDVGSQPDAPRLTEPIPDQTAPEDALFSFNAGAFFEDPDAGDSLTFTAIRGNGGPLPAWLSFANGVFTGTPQNDDVGSFLVSITATDTTMRRTSDTFLITVQNTNDAPFVANPIADQTAMDGTPFSLNISNAFADPDVGDTLSFTATLAGGGALPGWLSFNGTTGIFSGTPDDPDVGTVEIRVAASDTGGSAAADNFMLTVENVNEAPIVQDDSFSVMADDPNGTVVGTADAFDPDGDDLTFQIISGNDAGGFAINAATGVITLADNTVLTEGAIFSLVVQAADTATPPLTGSNTITITVGANQPPVAMNDSGFETIDSRDIEIPIDDLTDNDSDPEMDPISLQDVQSTSTLGASVMLDGINVIYDPTTSETLVALRPGEERVDTFEYTIIDGQGGSDTATVSVTVVGVDVVEIRLETFDTEGNSISTIQTGGTFELRAFIRDLQPEPVGVFSAFMDVTYTTGLISVDGSIQHSSTYGAGTSGNTTTPGLIGAVGGVDGLSPLGGDEFEVFRLQFEAGSAPGAVTFASQLAEDQVQNPILMFRTENAQPDPQIVFGTSTLTITGPASALSSGFSTPGTNPDNPYDVNADESVSPLDALLVINELGGNGAPSSTSYVDVNADGNVSPLDALLVINELGSTPQAALSSTAGGTGSGPAGVGFAGGLASEGAATDAAAMGRDDFFSDLGSQSGDNDRLALPGPFAQDASFSQPSGTHASSGGGQADEQDDLLTELALALV